LDYDQYRDIRFRAEKSLWRDAGLPFEIQLAPLGFLFKRQVAINVVADGDSTPVEYANDLFDYGKPRCRTICLKIWASPASRCCIRCTPTAITTKSRSFWARATSAPSAKARTTGCRRAALAIDTGLPKPEEFPYFREFWLEKPGKDATELTVYALLDSQSVTGAYRFVIKPGVATQIEVKASLFVRDKVCRSSAWRR
jgi:glucans biosynthesis protein